MSKKKKVKVQGITFHVSYSSGVNLNIFKWFFHVYLGFILFFVLSFYRCLICRGFIDVWFVVGLLRRGIVRRLVAMFYLCGGDSDKQGKFDQSKISNYGSQYVEELELQIF